MAFSYLTHEYSLVRNIEADAALPYPDNTVDSTKMQSVLDDIATALTVSWRFGQAFRNHIPNAAFDLWNQGTSFASVASDTETADGWYPTVGSGDTISITRQAFTLGQTTVPGNPRYYFRVSRTATGANDSSVYVPMPGVERLGGQTVTVSFYAEADAVIYPEVHFVQDFGSGGSSDVATSAQQIAVITSWSQHQLSFSIPSITGKTIGTSDATRLVITLKAATGNAVLDLSQVQVEINDTGDTDFISPFESRGATIEDFLINGTASVSDKIVNQSASTKYTISSGAITPSVASFTVDTESDAASDDLDTITATNFQSGDIIYVAAAHTDRTVVLKHNTGNIHTANGSDLSLDSTDKTYALRYNGSDWIVLEADVAVTGATDDLARTQLAQLWFTMMTNDSMNQIDIVDGIVDDFNDSSGTDSISNGTITGGKCDGDAASNMVVTSDDFTADAAPDEVRIVLVYEPVDSVTLNTDNKIEVSRDGGTTYTTGTLVAAYDDGSEYVVTSTVDVSGQPSGTTMKWKYSGVNSKQQDLNALSMTWG